MNEKTNMRNNMKLNEIVGLLSKCNIIIPDNKTITSIEIDEVNDLIVMIRFTDGEYETYGYDNLFRVIEKYSSSDNIISMIEYDGLTSYKWVMNDYRDGVLMMTEFSTGEWISYDEYISAFAGSDYEDVL